ncbi:MAG: inositol monophosphatase family protein, partial [Parachlamydiaceae bacterium]
MKSLHQKDLQDWLKTALAAASGAGKILKKHWGKLSDVSEKSHPGDLVTIADLESEKLIVDLLHSHYPNHSILAEESGIQFVSKDSEKNAFIWAIDPLDGTTNYTHNFPMVCVSIALLHQQK